MPLFAKLNSFFQELIIEIIIIVILPSFISLRLWIAKYFEYYSISTSWIIIVFFVAAIFYYVVIKLFRKYLYIPIRKDLSIDKRKLLMILGAILIILHLCSVAFGIQVYFYFSKDKYQTSELSAANNLIKNMNGDPYPNEEALLKDAIIFINRSSEIRKNSVDQCHSISTLKVDVEWMRNHTVWRYGYKGKTHNINIEGKEKFVLKTLHWADMPVWEYSDCIKVYNIKTNSLLEYEIKRNTIDENGKNSISYYITTIKDINEEFDIFEEVDWPCGLWREPDGIVVDCSRFKMGIDKLEVNLITETGTTLTNIYEAILNKDKIIDNLSRKDKYEASSELPYTEAVDTIGGKSKLWIMNMVVNNPDPNGLYIFIIHKRDIKRNGGMRNEFD